MAEVINNKNNSNSNTTSTLSAILAAPIDFFYSHIEEMSLFGVTSDESETIIITRRESPEATITTSDSTMFTKIRKNIIADPEHKDWKVQAVTRASSDNNQFHFIEIQVTCPKKLISLRSKTTTKELTDEQKEAMRERMSKMWKNRGNSAETDDED